MSRESTLQRKTAETDITVSLVIDGAGRADLATGVGFLDHMLTLFSKHGLFDLSVRCQGDTQVDDHHTVEDVGIVLGQAFRQALGDKAGIVRYGSFTCPMDEALVACHLDLSGRAWIEYGLALDHKIGTFDAELVREFFVALAANALMNLHLVQLAGQTATMSPKQRSKPARARSTPPRVTIPGVSGVPSTKGSLNG